MQVTRIYADESGESHFEDIEVSVSPVDFAPPAPPLHISSPVASAQMLFASLPRGWFGDWHPAPRRQYWVGLRGTVEVSVSDGASRRFGPGSVVLLEDVSGKGHVTRVVDEHDAQGMFVQL